MALADSAWVRTLLGRGTFVVLAAATALGWMLAFEFRRDPDRTVGPLGDPAELIEWGRLSVLVYRSLLDTSALFAVALALLVLRARQRGLVDRRVMWSAFAAVIFTLIAVVTWRFVEYDDVWLIPVPNRTAFNGFLPPAVSDQVAAFQVRDTKVQRTTYLSVTVIHLLATPAALAMIGMCLRWSPRAGRAEPDPSPQHP
ncbi:MAG: hypothetical protein V9E94_14955 [Microthrixaceae bacterium]